MEIYSLSLNLVIESIPAFGGGGGGGGEIGNCSFLGFKVINNANLFCNLGGGG